MMGTGTPAYDEKDIDSKQTRPPGVVVSDGTKDQEELDMFSMITKPRVRYDVEVVTKLIVYSGMFHSILLVIFPRALTGFVGIGWLAVEGAPIVFHYLGLGL